MDTYRQAFNGCGPCTLAKLRSPDTVPPINFIILRSVLWFISKKFCHVSSKKCYNSISVNGCEVGKNGAFKGKWEKYILGARIK